MRQAPLPSALPIRRPQMNPTPRRTLRSLTCLAAALCALTGIAVALAGPLTPPASPVVSTGKTTQEIFDAISGVSTQVTANEPRIAVNATNTPGGITGSYIISQPGSYYLTGNIIGQSGKNGIVINASHVTLDLNGFAVRGNGGVAIGVTTGVGMNAIVIRNGIVENWASAGISTNSFVEGIVIDHIIARGNVIGIAMSANAGTVTNCTASSNTAAGFDVSVACQISDCTASANGGIGFDLGNSCIARRCMARNNGGGGFKLIDNAETYDCHAIGNTGDGFNALFACNVVRCTAIANTVWGINVQRFSRVSDCYTRSNTALSGGGILLADTSAVCSGNTCEANSRGIVATAASNTIIRNNCIGSTSSNYVIVANNKVGTILNPTNCTAINGNSGGGLGTTDPFANFAY